MAKPAPAQDCHHVVVVDVDASLKVSGPEESTGRTWLLTGGDTHKLRRSSCEADAAPRPNLFAGMRLVVATFFCLLWNATGVVIIKSSACLYVKSAESRDVVQLVTMTLTAVPFLCVGSLLLWLVTVEWWKRLMKPEGASSGGSEQLACSATDHKSVNVALKPHP